MNDELDLYDMFEDKTLITNFNRSDRALFEKAIELSGHNELYITDDATNVYRNRLPNLLALRTSGSESLSYFWDVYQQLKEESAMNKQIEKMAKTIAVQRGYGCSEQDPCDMSCQVFKVGCMPYEDAQILYNAGHCEQNEGKWEWFEEWSPSTTEHPRECDECGWRCGKCKTALADIVGGYWDDPDEKPNLNFCPDCGAKMKGGAE